MKFVTLDGIVRGYLLKKRYPMHYYIECLVQSAECLSELHFDSLRNIRIQELVIGEYGAATLPCDYMDYTKVGIPNGQFVKPLTQSEGLTRLNNYDDNGDKILFPDQQVNSNYGFGNFVWYNDKMETTGRFYGGLSNDTNVFKILKERNEIEVHNGLNSNTIVLEYISDGSEVDNATQINPYVKMTIEAYIEWKYIQNSRSHGIGEEQWAMKKFEHERKIARGRLNDITMSDIKNAIRRNTHASIKG